MGASGIWEGALNITDHRVDHVDEDLGHGWIVNLIGWLISTVEIDAHVQVGITDNDLLDKFIIQHSSIHQDAFALIVYLVLIFLHLDRVLCYQVGQVLEGIYLVFLALSS